MANDRRRHFAALLILLAGCPVRAQPGVANDRNAPVFEVTFDEGWAADRASGRAEPTASAGVTLVAGKNGHAAHLAGEDVVASVTYAARGNVSGTRGTIDFAIRLGWDYTDSESRTKRSCFTIGGVGSKNLLYLNLQSNTLVFGIFDDDGVVHAVYGTSHVGWRAGEWHGITCTWDLGQKHVGIALDGVMESDRPSNPRKGSWRVNDAALQNIRLGASGGKPIPLDFDIDDFRIYASANAVPLEVRRSPTADRDSVAKVRGDLMDTVQELQQAIARADLSGLDTSYASAVATTAEVGLWRLFEAHDAPTVDDANAYATYITQRCRAAIDELAELSRDPMWNRRVPNPSVLTLHIDGDRFRTEKNDDVLLIGIRNVQPEEFADLATYFNLMAWNSAAPDKWIAQVKSRNFAGQAHIFWTAPVIEAIKKHPEMRNVGGWCGHNWAPNLCVDSEIARQIIADAITRTRMLRTAPDPAVVYGLLSAEDEYMCYCDHSIAMFRDWLQRKYRTITGLNTIWNTQLPSFDEATPPRWADRRITPNNRAAWFDWQLFNRARTTAMYAWLKQCVRSRWPNLPVCGGRHLHLADNHWGAIGVDPQGLNASVNDVVQCETVYDPPTQAVAFDMPPYGMDLFAEAILDFQTATCGKPATDLEYHAWLRYTPALAARHERLPANYTHTAILRHFLHGIRAANIWVWGRKSDTSPAPQSFAASPTIPLESVEECLRGALDVRRLASDIIKLSHAPRQVALMVSDASFLQVPPSLARGGTNSPLTAELDNVYHGSMFLDTPLGFVSERSIAGGALSGYRVVLVPAISHIDDATLAALLRFVDAGGTLVVTPRSFEFDPYNHVRPGQEGFPSIEELGFVGLVDQPTAEQLRDPDFLELQAVNAGDPRVPTVNMRLTDTAPEGLAGQQLAGTGVRLGFPQNAATAVAHFEDNGRPAILRRDRGTGHIYYSAIPLRPQGYARLLDAVLAEAGVARPVRVRGKRGEPVWGVEARCVRDGDDLLVYAINLLAAPVDVQIVAAQTVVGAHDLLANKPGDLTLHLDALETAILRLKVAP
ncbi:MAG: beta-galactosidase trimerization domain-containing protein [Phycisphaerales bacterium]|nr:beta-galactosidase trimerization domain-containing protein [Phycisphaerales bacterium]